MLPEFRTVSQTGTLHFDGLYKLANAVPGDTLKEAKDGSYWGSLKTETGKSKMLKLTEANDVTMTSQGVAAINPAILMMAASLYSIEKQIRVIANKCDQITSFLEIEKQARMEADVNLLMDMLSNYKEFWDNEAVRYNKHNQALDIQRSAYSNIISSKKSVEKILENKKRIVTSSKVKEKTEELSNQFKYYRIGVYTYAMATYLEIMLEGNFAESYIDSHKNGIEELSLEYRILFSKCSAVLEEYSNSSVEVGIRQGLGSAGVAAGKLIESIPVIRKGPIDEKLSEDGRKMLNSAEEINRNVVQDFMELNDPGVGIFINKLNDVSRIFNHTNGIYFDKDNIYFIA